MNKSYTYEIRVEGNLPQGWSHWFEGLAIHNVSSGEAILSGMISDQAALFAVLNKIQSLNLNLIAVIRSSRVEG